MRLWSIHPMYLDRVGLVACWREALLAQKVLAGETRGYKHHAQLARFRGRPCPLRDIALYLWCLHDEATRRGYRFDHRRIRERRHEGLKIEVGSEQARYEAALLLDKVLSRDGGECRVVPSARVPRLHPLFRRVATALPDEWERVREGVLT